ncbi:MAG: epoxyqueuosine reductase QueH [Kiritimatiellia bacterium]|jgi:predicted adenine nucleotide alpha hydrolase (AANH) superfamily ATPase
MKKILLHACCGPCSTHCVATLRDAGYEPTLFYSNSNIMPQAEYDVRLDSLRRFAQIANVALVEDVHDNARWLACIKGLENEPEKGARCRLCYGFNLRRAAAFALENAFAEFTTTLTVSPHKPSPLVFAAGDAAAAETTGLFKPTFRHFDFKKKDGFLDSVRLAKEYGLYRQSYCGCLLSQKMSQKIFRSGFSLSGVCGRLQGN